jgi:mannose-1-phosphate guanylyltransferase
MRDDDRSTWAIVLAGGHGARLAPLTRALHGWPVPKQFAALIGDRTLLQRTIDRVQPLVPAERTVVVVNPEHAPIAGAQLADRPGSELLVQPRKRGTGPGLLLPLAHVLARDPRARVVVLPSDHHVERPEAFLAAIRAALDAAARAPAHVALVGVVAERPSVDLGWIVPLPAPPRGVAEVGGFVEKPPPEIARSLLAGGALWNTMVLAGDAAAMWRLAARHLPAQASCLAGLRRRPRSRSGRTSPRALARRYEAMPPADLSHDVLTHARGLGLVVMSGAGWSDCGTPERLVACLEGKPELALLERRLGVTGLSESPPGP